MTAQFHEGQEVEVRALDADGTVGRAFSLLGWRKAKIVYKTKVLHEDLPAYAVQFPDGTRAVFDAAHIRAEDPLETAARYLNQGGTIEGGS